MHGYRGVEQGEGAGDEAGIAELAALAAAVQPLGAAGRGLLGSASHELRTPLTSAVGYVELLADGALGPVTDDQERVLRAVARNLSQLMALIDVLDPARPAVGPG